MRGGWPVIALFLLALLLPAGTVGCRSPASPAERPAPGPRPGGSLREAVVGAVDTLHPLEADDPAERVLLPLVFSALAGIDARGQVYPDLALGWVAGAGGRVWTVRLRADAVWHDGEPVTARDVAFTLRYQPTLPPGLSWEKVDERALRFSLQRPDAGFPYWLATLPILPAHLLGEGGDARCPDARFGLCPVGTGPFLLVAREGNEFRFLPHGRFHRGSPYLEELRVRLYPSLAEAGESLLRGETDLAPFPGRELARLQGGGWRILETHSSDYIALAFNCARVDADVRRAMCLGIDRQALAREVGPEAREVRLPWSPASWIYPAREASAPFPEPVGPPAEPVSTPSKPVSLPTAPAGSGAPARGRTWKLYFPAGDEALQRAARFLAASLGCQGWEVEMREEDPSRFAARLEPPFDYDLALTPQPFLVNPDPGPLLDFPLGSGRNVFAYQEAEMRRLLGRWRGELEPEGQMSLARQVAELLQRDVPLYPLWTNRLFYAVDPRWQGPLATPFVWHGNVQEWWWRR